MSLQAIEYEAFTLPAIEFQAEEQRKQLKYTLANFAIIRFKKGIASHVIRVEG